MSNVVSCDACFVILVQFNDVISSVKHTYHIFLYDELL